MAKYPSGTANIQIEQFEPEYPGKYPALLVLHGAGGAASYWLNRFAPMLIQAGVALYAPRYFQKTATQFVTASTVLDAQHFMAWLNALRDAVTYVAARPCVDADRIGVLGISLGGYLATALAIEDKRVRAVVELSGGVPPGWEERMNAFMAPTLVLHGEQDQLVPAAEAHKLALLLEERKVPHEVEIFSGESHWFTPDAQMGLLTRCAEFLGKYLFADHAVQKAS